MRLFHWVLVWAAWSALAGCATSSVASPGSRSSTPRPGGATVARVQVQVEAASGPFRSNATLTSVFAWENGRAVVVADDGSIARTDDHGAHWHRVAKIDRALFVVRGREDGIAVAGGARGALLVTTDFGSHWRPLPCPLELGEGVIGVSSLDVNASGTLVLSTQESEPDLYASPDLGESWTALLAIGSHVTVQRDGSFVASLERAVGHEVPIAWTQRIDALGRAYEAESDPRAFGVSNGDLFELDGALLHERLALGVPAGNAGATDARGRCAVVGRRGALLVAFDECARRRLYDTQSRDDLLDVALSPDGDLYAVGVHGAIIRLLDEADRAERVTSGDAAASIRVASDALGGTAERDSDSRFERARTDAQHALWLFGTGVGVMRSEDSGETFTLGTTFLDLPVHDAWVTPRGDAFVLVNTGATPRLFVSHDRGAVWEQRELPGGVTPRFIAGLDDAELWIAGEGGPPLMSHDGGETFTPRPDVTRRDVHALASLPGSGPSAGLWLATVDGDVLHSIDGHAWAWSARALRAQVNDIASISGVGVALATDAGLELSDPSGSRFAAHDAFRGGLRVVASRDSVVLATGDYQSIYVSYDGGATFARAHPSLGVVRALAFTGRGAFAIGADAARQPVARVLALP